MARPDGDLDWLTERPAPKGFYGLLEFERSTDAKILGRKTFDRSVQMGARFRADAVRYVFSRRPHAANSVRLDARGVDVQDSTRVETDEH